ncbi:MAG: hypothetical protein V4580_06550 [Bacteroidota bacterium]
MSLYIRLSYLSLILLLSCSTQKKYTNYTETVATITGHSNRAASNSMVVGLIKGDTDAHNSYRGSIYTFTVKRKVNEHTPDEGEKNPDYDFTMYGEDACGEIGEKFVVKYDPHAYDNFHSFLIRYRPVFLDDEKTIATTGRISKIYGKDALYQNAIALEFTYTGNAGENDTLKTAYTKYQYVAPGFNLDSMNVHLKTGKAFKVLYSPENPKRAILYYDQLQ